MNSVAPGAEPFFLDASPGQRLCLYHPPAGACRGALLYVHPFADEMNKSRRVAAQFARELAGAGVGVLHIDLYGCGDSSGDFADARWALWKQDLALAHGWLAARLGQPVSLLGLRLGALLALDYAATAALAPARLVLWHPVTRGATFLKQFLRLLAANDMMAQDPARAAGPGPRETLLGGKSLEVGGYEIAPALGLAIDQLDGAALAPIRCPADWFEVVASAERPFGPASADLAAKWRQQGAQLTLHTAVGLPFWATQEIAEAPALVAATKAALLNDRHDLSRNCA